MTERLLRFGERKKLSKAPVLVVDSLQRCRSRVSDAAPDPRQRVDAVLAACKRAVNRGIVVIATSEVNRGSYRSKKVEEQTTDLAATKESGYIEFAAQTLLILKTTAGDDDVVSVATPKNRGGTHASFRLRLDRETMGYTEVQDDGDGISRAQLQLVADADALRAIVKAGGIPTIRALRAACQAGGKLTNNERIDAARAHLEAQGRLVKKDGVYTIAEMQAEDCLQ
jgi:hypothetical protein